MPINTLPVAPSSAPYTVAFADSATTAIATLTESERREHDRLPHDARRRDWLAGRCAAKRAVAARCGAPLALDCIQLEPRAGAAPLCMVRDDSQHWTPLPFSLSIAHRDGLAIAAAADSATLVGVDIERVDEIVPEHYRYFLAQRERSSAARIDATLVWVLKEAAWKALGLGAALPFTALQLAFARDTGRLQGVWVESAWMAARAHVMRFSRPRHLLAAVVEIKRETQ